jgi:hypothetical protein
MPHTRNIAMLTAGYDRSAQEEGFIADWVDELAAQVDNLLVIVLKPVPVKPQTNNITVYQLKKQNLFLKTFELWSVLSRYHQKHHLSLIFNHIFPFLAVPGSIWGRVNQVTSAMWYAGGLPFRFLSLTSLALHLNNLVFTCSSTEKRTTKPTLIFLLIKYMY